MDCWSTYKHLTALGSFCSKRAASTDIVVQTQTAMEELTIDNIRSALQSGTLKTPVPEQADLWYIYEYLAEKQGKVDIEHLDLILRV